MLPKEHPAQGKTKSRRMPTERDASHRNPGHRGVRPFWDVDRRELWVGEVVVKEFRRPAPLLERILAALEEDAWCREIADPLPPKDGVDPKCRLHDAIQDLNGCQSPHLIRFYGNGDGTGVRWEHVK